MTPSHFFESDLHRFGLCACTGDLHDPGQDVFINVHGHFHYGHQRMAYQPYFNI